MRKFICVILCFVLLGSAAFAVDLALIGGMRDGLALGLTIDQEVAGEIGARYGIELTEGKSPVIVFLGGKTFLTEVQELYPLHFGAGLVGYIGEGEVKTGIAVGVVLDKVFGIDLLSLEAGIDALANDSKIQIQAAYKLNSL